MLFRAGSNFGPGSDMSQDTSDLGSKCLGSEVSWVRRVRLPSASHTHNHKYPHW